MPASVTLMVTDGPSRGKHFTFFERTTALLGRDQECHIRIPKNRDHQTISRHHCLLDINPPDVCVRDLGSRSGTYVNGKLIGKRAKNQPAQEVARDSFTEYALHEGDAIKLGSTVLQVRVRLPSSVPSAAAKSPKITRPRRWRSTTASVARPAGAGRPRPIGRS